MYSFYSFSTAVLRKKSKKTGKHKLIWITGKYASGYKYRNTFLQVFLFLLALIRDELPTWRNVF